MNHPNASAGTAAKTLDKPRILQQIDTLNKTLSICHSSAGEIEHASDRILGPVPQDASKGSPVPPTDTIERKLQEVIDYADALSARLLNATQRQNSAV